MVKYTSEASAQILKEGLASRREALTAAAAARGGELEHFWAVNSTEWNVEFVTSGEFTDAQAAATQIVYQAAGYVERLASLPLVDAEEADAVMAAIAADRARTPGE